MTAGATDVVDLVGLAGEIVTGAVFVFAGVSKVARRREWPSQAAEFGVPGRLAALVPWWELILGVTLLIGVLSPWAAVLSIVTLGSFTAAIMGQLRRGRHPRCACFGTWSAAPLGVQHVWRNLAFIVLAALAACFG